MRWGRGGTTDSLVVFMAALALLFLPLLKAGPTPTVNPPFLLPLILSPPSNLLPCPEEEMPRKCKGRGRQRRQLYCLPFLGAANALSCRLVSHTRDGGLPGEDGGYGSGREGEDGGVRVSLRLSLLQPFRLVSVSSQKEVLYSSLDGKGRGGEKSVLSTGFLSSAEPFPLFSASAASAVRRRPPAPSFLQLFCFGWTVSLLFSSPLGLLVFPVVAAAFCQAPLTSLTVSL